jgi:hypothetical protein
MRRLLGTLTICLAIAAPAQAEVKLVSNSSGKFLGMQGDGQTITYVKGNKSRSETTFRGKKMVTITDLDARQYIQINDDKREAEITDMAEVGEALASIGIDDMSATVTPNGQKKTIAGFEASGYDVKLLVPMSGEEGSPMAGMKVAISGPVFVSKEAPGAAEYAAYFATMAERGLFLGDPRAAKAQAGNARGMAQAHKLMAEAGLPLESVLSITIEGEGMMAAMMRKMGNTTLSNTVTAVSAEALADDLFAVPAGYKVKTKK